MNKVQLIRVALIDDHDLLRNGICKFLESFGLQIVFEAGNGEEALGELKKVASLPDICIIDINMPIMSGLETTKVLTRCYPGIKVLAFSVNDDESDVFGMLDNGAVGYILKGADPDELYHAIKVVHSGRKYFSQGVLKIAEKYFTGQQDRIH